MLKRFFNQHFGTFEGFLFALFLLILPAIYSEKIMDPVLHSRYFYYSFFLFLFAIIFSYRTIKQQYTLQFNRFQSVFLIAISMYGIWHVVSMLGAINQREAWVYTAKEISFLLGIFFTVALLIYEPKSRSLLIKAMILSTSIFLIIGFVQLFNQDFTKFLEKTDSYYFTLIMNAVVSTCANKNQYADFLFLTLPFMIYGVVAYKTWWRFISIVVLLASLLKIGLLVSKSVWASTALFFLVSGLISAWYIYKHFQKSEKKIGISVKVAVALLIPAFIAASSSVMMHSDIKIVKVFTDKIGQIFNPEETLSSTYSADNPSSAQTRLIVWNKTFEMAKDNPITGVGPGNWRINLGKYGYDEFEYDIRQGVKNFMYPHNDIFGKAAETGFIGLVLFLFLILGVAYMSFKTISASNDIAVKVYSIAIVGMLTGYLIDLFVTFSRIRIEHNIVFIVIAAIAFNNFNIVKEPSSSRFLSRRIAKILLSIMMLFVMVNMYLSFQMFQGEKMARRAYVGNLRKNWKEVINATNNASNAIYTLDPFDTPVVFYRGNAYSQNKDLKKAMALYEEAYALHPNNLKVLNNLATSYDLTNNKTEALRYYREALSISPRYQDALVNISIVHYNMNQIDSALLYISRVPVDKNATDKFKETYSAICFKKALTYVNKDNIDNLKKWAQDMERITHTFIRFQTENKPFNQILFEDLEE